MNFYFSLKDIKKSNFSKIVQIMNQQTIEVRELKQIATLKNFCSSSQMAEYHPLLRVSSDHSSFQP